MSIETVREIISVASVLIKFAREDIVEKRDSFIAFLNEIGVKNEGRRLNHASFRKMISDLTDDEKKELIEEFNEGFEDIYRHISMHTNK